MLRRLLLLLAGLGVAAWLVGAGFVAIFEWSRPKPTPASPVSQDAPVHQVARAWGVRRGRGLYASGYTQAWGVEMDNSEYGVIVRRGALDRRAQTFPLSIRYASNTEGGLADVRLLAASVHSAPLDAPDPWQQVAATVPHAQGEFFVAFFVDVDVPAKTRAYRIVEVSADGISFSFSRSVPVAETFLGRAYDRVAWWPVFRWLP